MGVSVLNTIETRPGHEIMESILAVLLPDAATILDATHSTGGFWKGSRRAVVRMDIDPSVPADVRGDFTRLPFRAGAFDVVVFDPPYITHPSKAGTSRMARRFGAYPTFAALRQAVERGTKEAWRVARVGVVVKVQDQVRSGRYLEMTEMVRGTVGQPPYARIDAMRSAPKIGAWKRQFSPRSNGATYLVFRHGSQYHAERGVA